MANQTYNWERYWCPVGHANQLNEGFLGVYESPEGILYPQDIKRFSEIAGIPCLVLLGEAGMGKTHAMQGEEEALRAHGHKTLLVKLGDLISSDTALFRYLFDDDKFKAWTTGSHPLHLFLDGFDECQSSVPTLGALLAAELRRHHTNLNRLSLRIACRTGSWNSELEDRLKQLWNKDEVGIYELAQLTADNVREAALANQLDANAFIQEVSRQEVIPLAARPITLSLLLKIYQKEGQIPANQVDLYQEGCIDLCREYTENRQGLSQLDAQQRLAISARIAAVSMLTGQAVIWKGLNLENFPSQGVIPIQDLEGGKEQFEQNGFPEQVSADRAAILETLSTGLFCGNGPDQVGWTHQIYAEFLAAWYLKQRQLSLPQIKSLLFLPDGKLIPQLRGVAAWVASLIPEMFQTIAQSDPEVLLQSRSLTDDLEARKKLIGSLLSLCNQGLLSGQWIAVYFIDGHGPRLAHPKLEEQLQPWICNTSKDKDEDACYLAITIARECQTISLQESLADIALDPSEPLEIRKNAAETVCKIADEQTKVKLKPLATEAAEVDPEQELKAWGLKTLWPNHIGVQDLLLLLTPTRQRYIGGEYQQFIANEITEHLQPEDLASALQWLETQPTRRELSYPFTALSDRLIYKAWDALESPQILAIFSRIALKRLREHDQIIDNHREPNFRTLLSQDVDKRRSLIEAIFINLISCDKDPLVIPSTMPPLILDNDFNWMLERLEAKNETAQRIWAQLIQRVFRWLPGQPDAVLNACELYPVLKQQFNPLREAIPLNSEQSQKLKQGYLQQQQWEQGLEQPDQTRSPLNPPPRQRIVNFLNTTPHSNPSLWPHLVRELTLKPEDTFYGDFWKTDVTTFPGWQEAEDSTRSMLLQIARDYLSVGDPETQKWLGQDQCFLPAHAGYVALELLLKQDPDLISTVTPVIWQKWAPVILTHSSSSTVENVAVRDQMNQLAYQNARNEVLKTLGDVIDSQTQKNRTVEVPAGLEKCWDENLEQALLNKLKSNSLNPDGYERLLSYLLDHGSQEAQTFAQSLIPTPLPTNPGQWSIALCAARALLFHAEGGSWSVVWPAIQKDSAFGRKVVESIQFWGLGNQPAKLEQPHQLADLYIWLSQQFPFSEGVEADEIVNSPKSHADTEEEVHWWRNAILHQLRDLGAYQSIHKIIQALPVKGPNLKWLLVEAQTIARSHEWKPPNSQEILELARNEQSRIIRSSEDLVNAVVESLERLQQKLDKNETIAVVDLWNEFKPSFVNKIIKNLLNPLTKKFVSLDTELNQLLGSSNGHLYTPKDENTFSDYIKRHLDADIKDRGIVVSREVNINRRDSTDIRIDTVTKTPDGEIFDSVSVIIEVKGSWNKELNQAMQSQLLERYLNESDCQHGLYLVGWFNCSKWSKEDYRKADADRYTRDFNSIDAAKQHFAAEAQKLSQPGKQLRAFVLNAALP